MAHTPSDRNSNTDESAGVVNHFLTNGHVAFTHSLTNYNDVHGLPYWLKLSYFPWLLLLYYTRASLRNPCYQPAVTQSPSAL